MPLPHSCPKTLFFFILYHPSSVNQSLEALVRAETFSSLRRHMCLLLRDATCSSCFVKLLDSGNFLPFPPLLFRLTVTMTLSSYLFIPEQNDNSHSQSWFLCLFHKLYKFGVGTFLGYRGIIPEYNVRCEMSLSLA